MSFTLMVYVRLVVTSLVIISCLLGDIFVENTRHPLLKAVCDNGTHAVIGALSGIAFVVQFYDKITDLFGWILIFLCFISSSFIDLDHFIAAKSFSLEAATAITHRPFLHCSTIPLILFIIYLCTACLNCFRLSMCLGIICIAFFTHHTRDAIRHGYWLWPFGSTARVPHLYYIFGTVAIPYIVFYFYIICRSSIVGGGGTGNTGKIRDDVVPISRSTYRYSIV